MELLFCKFNSYFNRRVIRGGDSIEDYLSFAASNPVNNFSYQPKDEIDLEQVINRSPSEIGDYAVVSDGGKIIAKYFVIGMTRNAVGQYRVSMRRDVIAEYFDLVVSSPAYIEKATLPDSDPLIFNQESLELNRIKTEEHLLTDETESGWIVGYAAKNWPEQSTTIEISTMASGETDYTATTGIANFYKKYQSAQKRQSAGFMQIQWTRASARGQIRFKYGEFSGWFDHSFSEGRDASKSVIMPDNRTEPLDNLDEAGRRWIRTLVNESYGYISDTDFSLLMSMDGKTVKDAVSGQIYFIEFRQTSTGVDVYDSFQDKPAITQAVAYYCPGAISSTSLANGGLGIAVETGTYILRFVQQTVTCKVTLASANQRYKASDAPYDMFCIPYGDCGLSLSGTGIVYMGKESAVAIAQAIAVKATTSGVYDLQLLPYCPIAGHQAKTNELNGKKYIDVSMDRYDQVTETDGPSQLGAVLWCSQTRFSKTVAPLTIPRSDDIKTDNCCNSWRLSSPNCQGIFEFSPEMNGGVEYWVIDCDYKPYSPYIHISPHFGGLYGRDFGDARGLICGGSFSIGRIGDAFAEYELQNKNYNNIFNREILSLDKQQNYERIHQLAGIASGSFAGVAGGAFTGAKLGGPVGGAVGAIAGGALSAGAGVVDWFMSEDMRREQIDYKTDMFNYSLQNIKALPYSLSNVSSFNANNKIFPFVEKYTCTERERKAFKDKIKWNGMTVGAIGKISDYLYEEETYVKAQIIRLDASMDYRLAAAIKDEMEKGVYIKQ